ncbi:hypothetical protein D9M70_361790 [compost metagenome]
MTNVVAVAEVQTRFVKQSFMGIELDILVGHPEHDILFIATQVARAAGLKDPAASSNLARKYHKCGMPLSTLIDNSSVSVPKDVQGRKLRSTTVLFTEPEVYAMLLRGHAPASEPFRKWVTEEVLPTIRKTRAYNIHASETPEANQFAGELAKLHVEMAAMRGEVADLKFQNSCLSKQLNTCCPECSPP